MNSKPNSTPPWIILFIAALAVVALGAIYACRVQLRDVSYRPTMVEVRNEGTNLIVVEEIHASPTITSVLSEPEMVCTNLSIMNGALRFDLSNSKPMTMGEQINFMAKEVYQAGFLDGMQIMDNRIRAQYFTNGMSAAFFVFGTVKTFEKLQEKK